MRMMPDVKDLPRFALDRAWIYKVSVLADQVARRVGEVVRRVSGLNLSQWRVIAAIADRPGRTASEVVAITPMDKGIVSRATATLVERGLVQRRASSSDGRLSHLFLTNDGEDAYQSIIAALATTGADGMATLDGADTRAFLAMLEQATALYSPTDDDAATP